jgi:hypothetical protein
MLIRQKKGVPDPKMFLNGVLYGCDYCGSVFFLALTQASERWPHFTKPVVCPYCSGLAKVHAPQCLKQETPA